MDEAGCEIQYGADQTGKIFGRRNVDMAVTGIDGTGSYPVYALDKARGNVSNETEKSNFNGKLNNVSESETTYALHGKQDAESGETAVWSWVDVQSNTSFCFYKPKDFDSENPVYRVKAWDADGNMTERMVDVSQVDPKNCDAVELYARSLNFRDNGGGFDAVLKAAVANAVNRANERQKQPFSAQSYLTQHMNWVGVVKNIMVSNQQTGNWKGYLEWKKFLSFLEN